MQANVQINYFNPRSYKRSDICEYIPKHDVYVISIHAPTRGATFLYLLIFFFYRNFNPRSYKRSDLLVFASCHHSHSNFNPRSYKRSDGFGSRFFHAGWIISIHAPTRGATLTDPIALATAIYFNPRSYKRSDPVTAAMSAKLGDISIHAPTRGATPVRIRILSRS